jgi:hypothetical protein
MKELEIIDIRVALTEGLARRVISRSKSRVTFKWPSVKLNRMVHCESSLERDRCMLLDCDTGVSSYREQPAVISMEYRLNGETFDFVHYPDFLYEKEQRQVFNEIKLESEAKEPHIKLRTELLTRGLPTLGYSYELSTDNDILKPPEQLENAKYLTRYAHGAFVDTRDFEEIRGVFQLEPQIPLGKIRQGLLGSRGLHLVCRLIISGELIIDRNSPITDMTLIRWAATAEQSPPPG